MTSDSTASIYTSPPIIEATVEIRYPEAVSDAKVKKASDRLKRRYDFTTAEEQLEATLNFTTRSADFVRKGVLLSHRSADQANRVGMTNVSISWTRLAPYEGWEKFISWVGQDLAEVNKAWGVREVSRIGLRYINRIDIPISDDDLFHNEDYISFKLVTGPILDPQNGYQWIIRKEHRDVNLVSVVQSATVEPEIPGTAAFTFDIDVAHDALSGVDVPRKSDDILARLSEIRALKNAIFEAGLTPLAKEKFR